MQKHDVSFRKVNVDHTDARPLIQIFALPALFEGDDLIAYGSDIKEYIKKKSQTD